MVIFRDPNGHRMITTAVRRVLGDAGHVVRGNGEQRLLPDVRAPCRSPRPRRRDVAAGLHHAADAAASDSDPRRMRGAAGWSAPCDRDSRTCTRRPASRAAAATIRSSSSAPTSCEQLALTSKTAIGGCIHRQLVEALVPLRGSGEVLLRACELGRVDDDDVVSARLGRLEKAECVGLHRLELRHGRSARRDGVRARARGRTNRSP